MNFKVKKHLFLAALAGALVLTAQMATAAIFTYTDLYGPTVSFLNISEDTHDTPHALYGQPIYLPGNQLFFPTNFVSASTNGLSNTTQGDLTMKIKAGESFAIQKIKISEYGNYLLSGSGSALTSAQILSNYTINGQSGVISMLPKNLYSLPNETTGSFNGSLELDFSGLGIRDMDFFLSNILQTTSESGTTSEISKTFLSNQYMVEVYTTAVPIPAALWLLGSGFLALIGLRRKFTR